MANVKISDLPAAVSVAGTDLFEIEKGGVSQKATGTQIATFIGAVAGSVTSVAVANATGITWTGSPITSSGTFTPTLSLNLQGWSGIAPATKANANAVVATTGNQTGIAGNKTFTGTITAASFVPGTGKPLNLITVSSAAPGALANGTLYLRYA